MNEQPLEERAAGVDAESSARPRRAAQPVRRRSQARQVEAAKVPAGEVGQEVESETQSLVQNGESAACAHLGLEHDPFHHYAQPSSGHRCYLWMQRDRIDRSHQEMFCLTEEHKRCPWLVVSTPRRPEPIHRRVADSLNMSAKIIGGIEELESPWQRNILIALVTAAAVTYRALAAAWRVSQPVLLQLAIWLLFGLRLLSPLLLWPMRWLSRRYKITERTVLSAPGRLFATVVPRVSSKVAGPTPPATSAHGAPAPFAPATVGSVAEGLSNSTADADGIEMARLYIARGLEAMRDGDTAGALRRFRLATVANEEDEQGWLWRGALCPTPEEKAECFRRALAINPQNARARAALAELGVGGEVEQRAEQRAQVNADRAEAAHRPMVASAGGPPQAAADSAISLLEQGLAAMRSGDESLAYQYFSMASRDNPSDEQAWYWQAKTAPTIDEVVGCLRQIIAINPSNAKARADLEWALQRQARSLVVESAQPEPIASTGPSIPSVVVSKLRAGVLQLASVFAFASGLLASLPYVVKLMDLSLTPELQSFIGVLPVYRLPALPVDTSFFPQFDFGAIAPLLLGVLLLHAAFTLGDSGGPIIRIWTTVLGLAAMLTFGLYVDNDSALRLGVTLAAAAAAAAIAGKPESRAQSTPAQGSLY